MGYFSKGQSIYVLDGCVVIRNYDVRVLFNDLGNVFYILYVNEIVKDFIM